MYICNAKLCELELHHHYSFSVPVNRRTAKYLSVSLCVCRLHSAVYVHTNNAVAPCSASQPSAENSPLVCGGLFGISLDGGPKARQRSTNSKDARQYLSPPSPRLFLGISRGLAIKIAKCRPVKYLDAVGAAAGSTCGAGLMPASWPTSCPRLDGRRRLRSNGGRAGSWRLSAGFHGSWPSSRHTYSLNLSI